MSLTHNAALGKENVPRTKGKWNSLKANLKSHQSQLADNIAKSQCSWPSFVAIIIDNISMKTLELVSIQSAIPTSIHDINGTGWGIIK